MLNTNSVLALRARELVKSTKEFKARGYKVIRCEHCLIPLNNCICLHRPDVAGHCAFCFIMYRGEYYKPSNTGRIIADVVKDNYAFLWDRVAPDPELLTLLNNSNYSPILVFPQQYAEATRCIDSPLPLIGPPENKKPLFIMLDGTWREAKKMFKSPSLADIPVLGIQPEKASLYQLREAVHEHQLCTAEVAIEVLKLAKDHDTATALDTYFNIFRKSYIAGKAHLNYI